MPHVLLYYLARSVAVRLGEVECVCLKPRISTSSQWNWDALRCQDRIRGSHLGSEIDTPGASVMQKWLIVVWAICCYQRECRTLTCSVQ